MKARPAILLIILLVCLILILKGYKYYEYTKTDPEFCNTCHLVEEGVRTWRLSKHSNLICQRCHVLTLIEENRLLLAFAIKGSWRVKQTHGSIKPWEGCLDCHVQDASQGSVSLRTSYGHARHVFMQDIKCNACHRGDIHDFRADSKKCQTCHKDKLVHGMGMAGLYCLNCHRFGETKPKMVSQERCFECHKTIPTKGVMSGVKCFDCHKPHGQLKMESKDCLGTCHGNETRVGQHGKHLALGKLQCIDCHKPHTWVIKKENAPGLCDRCHPLRDPMTFIY